MSTSEEVPLQPVNSLDARDGNLVVQTESVEQDDTTDGQKVVASPKVTATPVTVSQWKKVFITVMNLFTYTSLYAAISMIAPFYPIEVSILMVTFFHIIKTSSLATSCLFNSLHCIFGKCEIVKIGPI